MTMAEIRLKARASADVARYSGRPERLREILEEAYHDGFRDALAAVAAAVPDGTTVSNPPRVAPKPTRLEDVAWRPPSLDFRS